MDENIIIKLLISIFGSIYGFRILKIAFEKSKSIFPNIKTNHYDVIFLIVSVFLFPFVSSNTLWILFFLSFAAILVTIFVTRSLFDKKLRQDFVFFVDSVLLNLKMGHSLRAALEKSVYSASIVTRPTFLKIIERILSQLEASPQFFHEQSAQEESIEEELRSWLEIQNKVIHRISTFRAQLRMEDSFRRKTEQVVQQIRLQIGLLTCMYLGILFFVVQRFSWGPYLPIYIVSFLLFLLGLLSFYYISRRKTWKI